MSKRIFEKKEAFNISNEFFHSQYASLNRFNLLRERKLDCLDTRAEDRVDESNIKYFCIIQKKSNR